MARLVVFSGGMAVVAVELGAVSRIGRAAGGAVQLADETVSDLHAVITRGADGRFTVEDRGSLNGTFVNGARVTKHVLGAGDALRLGAAECRFIEQAEAWELAPARNAYTPRHPHEGAGPAQPSRPDHESVPIHPFTPPDDGTR